jgi:hypothetical protein
MRWKEESRQRPFSPDFLVARHKISEAFREGYINWNMYNLAMEMVDRNIKGGWMFKKLKPEDK